MTESDPPSRTQLTTLASELREVARRHDPGWTGTSDADPGITLLELQAYIADLLGAYQDRLAGEAELATAQRGSGAVSTFRGNTQRSDPYRNFKFRVKWDGRVIPGVVRLAPLGWRAEVAEFRDGADPNAVQHLPGRIQIEPIVLERDLSGDTSFEAWAGQVRQLASGAGQAGASYRKNIRLELLDPAGRTVLAYDAYQCWPSGYRVVAGANAAGRITVSEEMTLSCEGWQRDVGVVWPADGS
jgi:phage tail-like protein